MSELVIADSRFYRAFLLLMNDTRPPFDDIRVRKAIDYSIPYAEMQAVAGDADFTPITKYSLEVEEAQRLLAEAGYPQGFQTSLLIENVGLTFKDIWPPILRDALAKVTIEIAHEEVSRTELLGRLKAGDYALGLIQGIAIYPAKPIPATAEILSIDCGEDFTLPIHIRITSDSGIESYKIYSTWTSAGRRDAQRDFSLPFPTLVEDVVIYDERGPDIDPNRIHQFGLWIEIPDSRYPLVTFARELNGRCPGHYRPR